MMAFLKAHQPSLDDEQRISRVTRSIQDDPNLAAYVPKRIPSSPAPPAAGYADVLEQVRALSIKAVNTYGDRVIEETRQIVRDHLEAVLQLAARQEEIEKHYRSEMEAVKRDTNDFTTNARRDLERLASLAPTPDADVVIEASRQMLDDQLNGKHEEEPPTAER